MSQGTGGRLSIRVQIEGIAEAEAKLKSLSSTIDSIGGKITATASSFSKLPQSLNSLRSAADSTAQSINKLPTALNAINTSMTSGIGGIDRLKASVTGLGGTLNTAASSVQQFSSRVQASMQSISTGGGLTSVQTAVTGLNTTFNSGIPTIQRYGTTLTSLGQSASSTSGGLNTMKSGLDNLTASSEKAGQSAGRTTQQWATMGGRIGGVALSTVILTSAIDEAVGMQAMLEQAQGKTTMAQNAYNAAVAQFGPNSAEAIRAQQALDKAQNALTFATRNTGFAWRDIIPIAGLMVTQAIEPLIQGFSRLKNASDAAGGFANLFKGGLGTAAGGISAAVQSLATAFKPISTEATAATKGLDAVSVAMESTSQKAGLLRTSIGGLTFAGFLGVIGAVAAALLALATNVGGSRDAMNDLGESVAKQVPALEGLLTFFGKAIEGLGQLMGVQSEADKLWIANATKIAEANKLIETSLKGPFEAFQAFTDIVEQQSQLKPLDAFFGGGGLGQVLADLTQMTTIFDTMASSNDLVVDTLQPVINSLVRIKDEVNTFGGETLNRYNEAWAFANKLMDDAMNKGIEPTTQQLGQLRNMVNQVGSTINKDLIDPFEAAIASGDKWKVSGTMIQRNLVDTSATLVEMGNLVHVTGNTFKTESGNLITFAEGFTKIKDESANTEEGLKRIIEETERGKGILEDFIGGTPKLFFDYANAVKAASEAEAMHTIKLQESAAAFGATAVEIQKMTEVGGLAAFNASMAESDAASQQFSLSLRALAEDLGMGLSAFTSSEEAVRNWIATHGEAVPTLQEVDQAVINLAQSLIDDTKNKTANAEATRALIGSQIEYQNTIATLNEDYANTQASISRLNTELSSQEAIMLRTVNAIAQGDEKFLQFHKTLQDSDATAAQYKLRLEGFAQEFGVNMPGYMEGTVEEFEALNEAISQGGDAIDAFSDMALESWRGLVAGAEPLFNDLKEGWASIFEGTTMEESQSAIEKVNDQIRQNVEHNNQEIQKAHEKMGQNIQKNWETMGSGMESESNETSGKIVDIMDGVAPKIKDVFEGVDWGELGDAMADPFVEAFNKLPAAVSDTLDQTERGALIFQAKFAQVAEMAGTTWSTNLQANMGMGFDNAVAQANQAVLDMLAPFAAEHPEMAAMFNQLQAAMQQQGPGAAQAVQEILTQYSGMMGPVGDIAAQMLAAYQENFAGKLPGVTKGGVEGAMDSVKTSIDVLSGNLELLFGQLIQAINGDLNSIKQTNVPEISANPEKARMASSIAQQSIDLIRQSRAPDIDANGQPAQTKVTATQGQIDNIRQQLAPQIDVDTSIASQKLTLLQGQILSISQSGEMLLSAGARGSYGGAQFGQPWNPAGGGGYQPFQPGMFGAQGIGPKWVSEPTMILVGEGGEPELVSVVPQHKLGNRTGGGFVQAQEGFGDPYGGYGGGGGGMDPGAMQDAVQQGAQEGSQQGSQQGVQEGMQQGYQQAPSNTEMWGAGRFGWSPSGGMGGGGAGQYPTAPSNTEMWGAGMQYWGGGRFGTQLGGMGGAPPPQYPSASVPMGVNETIGFGSRPRYYTWTGGAMGTALTPSGPGLAPPPSQTQGQGQQMANDLTRGFQQGMGGQSQVWVNQGLKAGQNMGTGTLMGYEQFMQQSQGRWNSMPNTVFRGFPAGAATFGGLMGDAMMAAMGDVIGDSAAQIFPQLYDQWGNSFARMLQEFNQAASGGGGGGGGGYGGGGTGTGTRQPTMPSQNVPAYTGQVPASYGPPLGQSFGNAGRATMLPGSYAGTGQWPPAQPTGGGGGGGMTPQQMHQANQGGYPGSAPVYGVPGQSYGSPSSPGGPLSQPGGGYPSTGGTARGSWYGPNDPRNTVYAQHGFHGIIDKTTRFIAHANERVDITPGPRGQINTDAIKTAYKNEINDIVSSVKQMVSETTGKIEHFHIYLGNEKIKEIVRKTAGTQMDRFIR